MIGGDLIPIKGVILISLLVMVALIVPAFFATPVAAQVSSIRTLDSVGDVGTFSSVAVDSNGFVHIVYENTTSHTLKYATNSPLGKWSNSTIASGGGYWKGEWCSIALDHQNHPHVSYLIYDPGTTDAWVGYTQMTSPGIWTAEVWIDKYGGQYNGYCTDVAIDPSGYTDIVFGHFEAGLPGNDYPTFATNSGGSFSWGPMLDASGDYAYGGAYNSISIGPNGVPQVATTGTQSFHGLSAPAPMALTSDANQGLWYAVRSGTSWTYTHVEAGDVGIGAQIAVDSNNRAYISYESNATKQIRLAHQSVAGGAFALADVSSNGGDIYGGYTGIGLDPRGQLYISYQRTYGSGIYEICRIEVASYRNGTWAIDQVDQNSIFYHNYFTSIAVDPNGGAHLAYYDSRTNDAKYARLIYAPTEPTSPLALGGSGKITVTWSAPQLNGSSAIIGYNIYRDTNMGGETLYTTVDLPHALSFDDPGVIYNQRYYYKISAVNAVGEGPLSVETSAMPSATVPGQPGSFKATPGHSQIVLNWTAASEHGSAVTSYKVYRNTTSSNETYLTTVGNVLTYLDTDVVGGQTYYYKVSAVNGVGEGMRSKEASATPTSAPGAPYGLRTVPGRNQIALNWTAPSINGGSAITNYTVYRATTSGGEVLLVKLGNVLSYTDSGLTYGTPYFYKVSASNAVGEGPRSGEMSSTPTATAPAAPNLIDAISWDKRVTVDWSVPDNGGSAIIDYKVYRGTTPGGESFLSTVGINNYVDDAVTNGVTYYYKVSAVNAVGEGPISNEQNATPVSVPGAPTIISATPANAQVKLVWSAPTDDGGSPITHYKVYRLTLPGEMDLLVTLGAVLDYTDNAVTNGLTYYYIVSAVNSVGEGPQSNEASATPNPVATLPSAPHGLTAIANDSKVVLNWSAPINNGGAAITNYKVYRGTASGGETLLTTLGNVLTYTNTGLTNGQIYWYKVSAVNSVGEGPQSNEASATPNPVATLPSAPQLFVDQASIPRALDLHWSAPSSNGGTAITNYRVYRLGDPDWILLTTLGNVTGYEDYNLVSGDIYDYRVSAVNSAGEGALSNVGSNVVFGPPSAPQNLQARAGNGFINLTWQGPSNNGAGIISNYLVYRSTTSGAETDHAISNSNLWFNDTSVVNGQTYYYTVTAENVNGGNILRCIGSFSNEVNATPSQTTTVPAAPSLNSATPSNSQIVLLWTAPSINGGAAITGYRVYRGTNSGGETFLADTQGNVFNYTDYKSVTNGQIYYYKVSAVSKVGEGPLSNELNATPATVPLAPYLTSATPGNLQIVINWTAPSSNGGSAITNYKIYRDTTSLGVTLLATVGNVLTYTDTLYNRQTFFYKVSAVNAMGESSLSNMVSAKAFSVPGIVSGFSLGSSGRTAIAIIFYPGDDGGFPILQYNIYRWIEEQTSTPQLYTTLPSGFQGMFLDGPGLTAGWNYHYIVRAVNALGEGPGVYSAAVPVDNPSPPQNLTVTMSDSRISLFWDKPAYIGDLNLYYYRIYRGSSSSGETLLTTLAGNVLTYIDTAVSNGQSYYYKVGAVNRLGESKPSNEVTGVPGTPTQLTSGGRACL